MVYFGDLLYSMYANSIRDGIHTAIAMICPKDHTENIDLYLKCHERAKNWTNPVNQKSKNGNLLHVFNTFFEIRPSNEMERMSCATLASMHAYNASKVSNQRNQFKLTGLAANPLMSCKYRGPHRALKISFPVPS